MGRNGSENFKALLLIPIAAESLETSEFSSQWSPKSNVRDFWKFKIKICNHFFFVFVNMGPNGKKMSKRYSYESQPKVFKLLLIFFLSMVLAVFEIPSF